MNKKIKPCPYCGNRTPQIVHPAYNGDWMIYCNLWACNMPYAIVGDTLNEVIDDWNNYFYKVKEWLNEQT